MQVNPLILYGFMLLFLINPTKTLYYKSRFWLLKLLVSVKTGQNKLFFFLMLWLSSSCEVHTSVTNPQGKGMLGDAGTTVIYRADLTRCWLQIVFEDGFAEA